MAKRSTRFTFPKAKRRRRAPKKGYIWPSQRGYLRQSGFYGRYSGRGGELKFHDLAVDDAVIAAGGTVSTSFNLIAQGVTESTRVGRKCIIKKIDWKISITLPASTSAAGGTPDSVRIQLILDKQANGAVPVVADIMEDGDWQSFRNLANSGRFHFLMDKVIIMNQTGGAGDGATNDYNESKYFFKFHKDCNIPLEFSSTTGAITEIRSNNVFMMINSENGLAGLKSQVRIRFSDL